MHREYWCSPASHNGGCGRLFVDQRGLDKAAEALTIELLSDNRHADAIETMAREIETEAARWIWQSLTPKALPRPFPTALGAVR